MIPHTMLNEVLALCGATTRAVPALFGAVTVDSRTARPGDIFCAFKGERADAHSFVADLAGRGVLCVGTEPLGVAGYARVADIVGFLAALASLRRKAHRGAVLALTGSSGKTTTRILAERILEKSGVTVHATTGNLNNHIGLPLVMLNAPLSCDAIVLEMGMNHAGEIAHLCRIADPDAALITNIGFAHIGNFDSREELAKAKLEMFEHSRGRIAVNLDDPFVASWAAAHSERAATAFGTVRRDGDLWASPEREGSLRVLWRGREYAVAAPRVPAYLVEDLVAAAALAAPLVRDPRTLAEALRGLSLPPYRGEEIQIGERLFVADCYNANPDSMRKAIDHFVGDAVGEEERYLVLGDMAELGKFSENFHRELVKHLKTLTVVNRSFLIGEEFEKVRDEFIDDDRVAFFHSITEVGKALPSRGRFLVKGSRRNRMERLFDPRGGA